MPLSKWLVESYVRTAIIPLLLIEIGFLAIYWISGNFTYERNVQTVQAVSKDYLNDIANREVMTIRATLDGIEGLARFHAMETGEALNTPFDPGAAEKARYQMSPEGMFYTRYGRNQTASYYSGIVPVGPAQIDKVWRTAQLDQAMKHIKKASPLVRQVYLNTWDSYNRIYPYFDVIKQYPPKMSIPSYNFYYEADEKHNPARKVVWTDAYVDPAGSGWMVSAIAPVYSPKRLEAVIGIDLTVDTILKHILALNLPWDGYGMLIGRDGTILALPPAGERDLGLRELKDHSYDQAVRADVFKPGQFNINRRPELKSLAQAVLTGKPHVTRVTLSGKEMLAANASVEGPGWTLVVLAPASSILADANALRDQFHQIGMAMIGILLVFYAGFFVFLIFRARAMSQRVAAPLAKVQGLMDRIGGGEYDQVAPRFGVTEIDTMSEHLVAMGGKLGGAYRQILDQEEALRRSLDSEKRVTTGQRRFINILSHEFRTPLTVIDSCGQILRRRAARLTEETALERADMIRRATARIDEVMTSALQLVQLEEGEVNCRLGTVPLAALVREAAEAAGATRPDVTIRHAADEAGTEGTATVHADRGLLRSVLIALIENACKYSPQRGTVEISLAEEEAGCTVVIGDAGIGIAGEELPLVCERFFRGSNTTAVPGAGIGLYLADTLIRAQGGTLRIVSELGTGTRVTIGLPHGAKSGVDLSEAA